MKDVLQLIYFMILVQHWSDRKVVLKLFNYSSGRFTQSHGNWRCLKRDNVWYCNTKATPPISGWIGIRGWNCQTKDNIFSWCDHSLLVISFCTYTYSLYFGYTTIPNIPWFFCYQRITFLCIHTWHCLTSYHISKCYPFVRNIYLIFIYNHFVYGYIYIWMTIYTSNDILYGNILWSNLISIYITAMPMSPYQCFSTSHSTRRGSPTFLHCFWGDMFAEESRCFVGKTKSFPGKYWLKSDVCLLNPILAGTFFENQLELES